MKNNNIQKLQSIEDILTPLLKDVIILIREQCFLKEYRASDEECLGIAVAKYFSWDNRVLECCSCALEDANFHDCAAILDSFENMLQVIDYQMDILKKEKH